MQHRLVVGDVNQALQRLPAQHMDGAFLQQASRGDLGFDPAHQLGTAPVLACFQPLPRSGNRNVALLVAQQLGHTAEQAMGGDDWYPLGKGKAASNVFSSEALELGGGIQLWVLTKHCGDQRRARAWRCQNWNHGSPSSRSNKPAPINLCLSSE